MRTVRGRVDHVVVIGAGLSGLAAALHLSGRGRQVTVVERDALPGGRAGRLTLGGLHIDTGPTVLTMPEIIEETFSAVGDNLADRVDLLPVTPAYRAIFSDGSSLDVHSEPEAMAEAVTAFCGAREADGYRRLRAWLTELYRIEFDRFIDSNMDSPLSMLTPSLARLVAMGAFGRLDQAIGRFISDERLRRVFSFQSLYVGVPPHRALAVYAVIAFMDTVAGVFVPRGGVKALPDGLAAAAVDAGVRFHYGTTVTSLERRGTQIKAVLTTQGRIPCDAVVITTELSTAYRLLGRAPRRVVPFRASPSAVVLHLASRASWEGNAHHTVSFGHAWEKTFHELMAEGVLMRDPSLLITRPAATDPDLVDEQREPLSILAPVPNMHSADIDWSHRTQSYATELVRIVEGRLMSGLADTITEMHVVTPHTWAGQGMLAGSPFSLAHTLAQTGPFRPRNFPKGVDNAVLAGASTVPGVGVPTALLSGKLAADRIAYERVRQPVTIAGGRR